MADSESSSIRVLNLSTGGSQLLAGGDPLFSENLFQFGDRDSESVMSPQALFQHPLAVLDKGTDIVYIADSYNHKIKQYNVTTGLVKTLFGSNAGNLIKIIFNYKIEKKGIWMERWLSSQNLVAWLQDLEIHFLLLIRIIV